MRTGTVERLGMGYEDVAKVNPRIIYVAASAYGRTGPMAHFGAIDPEIQAMCGWCSIMGQEGGRGEMFRHLGHIDLTTSTYITQAVLQALLARERTGKGQKIEVEMLRAAMAIQTTRLAEYLATGRAPESIGQRQFAGGAPSGLPLPGPKIHRRRRGAGGTMARILPRA